MTKRAFLFVLSLFLLTLPVLSDELPQVLQPNETAYSAFGVATLRQAITALETTLNSYNLGSRRYFASDQWNSRDFAAYTGGTLSEMGYETKLVSGTGWPDGVHVWVLVGTPLGARTAWVPVEASPVAGHSQQTLGHVPSTTDAAGNLWYEESYLNFSEVIELPPNLPPVIKIRPPAPPIEVHENLRFMAIGSSDPDGEIVLYQWDFGDGKTEISTKWTVNHRFNKRGSYTISLTAIDNRGRKSATTSVTIRVVQLVEEPETAPPSSGGCGCGG
ncbi:PKD domain-containing protein [Candidatus Bipolaricaulota bacterium]|nr:PKD domain-containing protein [Candidatus Bipolaricaulota bacterium]